MYSTKDTFQNDANFYSLKQPGKILTNFIQKHKKLKAICSNEFLRNYHEHNHRLLEDVNWTKKELFGSSACQFIPSNIRECFIKKNISSIFIMGDSQGSRYARCLEDAIANHSMKCGGHIIEYQQGKMPSIEYFSKGFMEDQFIVKKHSCKGCASFHKECHWNKSTLTSIEYTAMEFLDDRTVTLKPHPNAENISFTYEFLLKVYLRNRFPDLIIFFLPMNHIKQRKTLEDFRGNLTSFLALYKEVRKPNSMLYFMPGTAESDSRRARAWKNRTFFDMRPNDRIYLLNKAAFNVLEKDLLDSDSRIHIFFGLFNASRSAMYLNVDGVHFKPMWYQVVINSFISTLCQSR